MRVITVAFEPSPGSSPAGPDLDCIVAGLQGVAMPPMVFQMPTAEPTQTFCGDVAGWFGAVHDPAPCAALNSRFSQALNQIIAPPRSVY